MASNCWNIAKKIEVHAIDTATIVKMEFNLFMCFCFVFVVIDDIKIGNYLIQTSKNVKKY